MFFLGLISFREVMSHETYAQGNKSKMLTHDANERKSPCGQKKRHTHTLQTLEFSFTVVNM